MRTVEDFSYRMRRTGAPVTVVLIGLLALAYVLAWAGMRGSLGALTFIPATAGSEPWTFLTYPFASAGNGQDLFFFLLTLLWLWFMGSAVEQEKGPKTYLALWVVLSLLGALSIFVGSLMTSGNAGLFGPMIPIAAITMIWCARNPESQILLMAVIPFKGKWLAWLTGLLVLFGVGNGNPMMGVFGLVPVLLAWVYGRNQIPFAPYTASASPNTRSRAERKRAEEREWSFQESVKQREKERQERDRLRKLFEDSMKDGTDDK